ncbi:MAG: RICIN domain-containing protein [Chloroflexi bacterium]|nr:RICIN domain-containing protein [Chloroflexota bacterium]
MTVSLLLATFPAQAQSVTPTASGSKDAAQLVGQTLVLSHVLGTTEACLEVQSGRARRGQDVWTYECNGTDAQLWRLEQRASGDDRGRYRLVSKLGGLQRYCLDNRADFRNSERMGIWNCVDDPHPAAPNQTFDLHRFGDRWTLTFVSADASVVLWAYRDEATVKGGTVGQQRDGTGSAAEWRIETYDSPAQTLLEPCPEVTSPDDSVALRATLVCLQEKLEETNESQYHLVNQFLDQQEQLEAVVFELTGPEKRVHEIPALTPAVSHGHWGWGQNGWIFECADRKRSMQQDQPRPSDLGLPETPPGFTRVGASVGGWGPWVRRSRAHRSGGRRVGTHCVPREYCNGHAEQCRGRDRQAGCFVNTDWYEWYTRRAAALSLPVTNEAVCAR